MVDDERTVFGDYLIRPAASSDLEQARSLMLDTLYEEFGYGYVPAWHADVVALEDTYLREPGNTLFVAAHGDDVVATAGVRAKGPTAPLWLASRYHAQTTAQVVRVYVRSSHRRRGLAKQLVQKCCEFVADVGGYTAIYLHTDTRVPGAEAFWRSIAMEVYDGRTDSDGMQNVHFEIPIPVPAAALGR